MKLEQSELFFIEELFKSSCQKDAVSDSDFTELIKLTGDASTRRYYRLFTNTTSYVVCLDNPVIDSIDEYPFISIQQFLTNNKIRVPKVFDYDLSKGYLLEEDLGNATLLTKLATINTLTDEFEIYRRLIDIIIKMQTVKPDLSKNYIFTKLFFDQEKLNQENNFSYKFFIHNFLQKEPEKDIILGTLESINKELANWPMFFTHRDFHSRNIMVKNSELILIDFQDARMGIAQYDLVSLLEDCYYSIDPHNIDLLKKYYWDNFAQELSGQESEGNFLHLYDLMSIQRLFKAIGSFCYIHNLRKDIRYLKYIGHSFEKIRKILLKYPEYSKMKNALATAYYES